MMTDISAPPRFRKRTLLTILWIATSTLIAVLLLHPGVPDLLRAVLQKPNRLLAAAVEYGAHLAVFLVATQFALVCCEATTRARRTVILALSLVAAILAEVAQAWVPTRGVDVLDAVFNCFGVALAGIFYNRVFTLSPVGEATA